MVASALIALCCAAQSAMGIGASMAMSLMCVSMFFQFGVGAIFFWYLGFQMLEMGSETAGPVWLILSILIAIWPWMDRWLLTRHKAG
jgi:hypothetical protein